jgi:hypothetical protein
MVFSNGLEFFATINTRLCKVGFFCRHLTVLLICHVCQSGGMEGMKKNAIIVGAILAGAAIGGALFMFYPDMMFQGTNFQSQSGSAPATPQSLAEGGGGTTTAGSGGAATPPSGGYGP